MEHGTFLNVGEFARICHTTRETLLHYDRKGLLKPAYVAENGYRRYSMKQYFDFDLICLLKEGGSVRERRPISGSGRKTYPRFSHIAALR